MSEDWQAAHQEAARLEQAAEAQRVENAAYIAAHINTELEFTKLGVAKEETAREAKAVLICPNHSTPTSIPGMCQLCIADAQQTTHQVPLYPDAAATDTWLPTDNDMPQVPEPGRRPSGEPREAPRIDTREQPPAPSEQVPPTVEPRRLRESFREQLESSRPKDLEPPRSVLQHRALVEAPRVTTGHGTSRLAGHPRVSKWKPPRQSAHPRGPVEFYCGNCCVLSKTPGYCTACGAMLKALEEVAHRPREPGDHDHHLLPSVFDRTIGFWKDRGIDRHEFCVAIPAQIHLREVHPLWNDEWSWFIMDHPDAKPEQIRAQMYDMMENYGLAQFPIRRYQSDD